MVGERDATNLSLFAPHRQLVVVPSSLRGDSLLCVGRITEALDARLPIRARAMARHKFPLALVVASLTASGGRNSGLQLMGVLWEVASSA